MPGLLRVWARPDGVTYGSMIEVVTFPNPAVGVRCTPPGPDAFTNPLPHRRHMLAENALRAVATRCRVTPAA